MLKFRWLSFIVLLLLTICLGTTMLPTPLELLAANPNVFKQNTNSENNLEGYNLPWNTMSGSLISTGDTNRSVASATPLTTTITVNGTVVDIATGARRAGAIVLLNGANPQTTRADGRFSYANVTPPYTLTARIGSEVYEYRGLTRADPQLPRALGYHATLQGNVTGPSYPLPADVVIGIAPGGTAFGYAAVDKTTGSYTGNVVWGGTAWLTTDLVAVCIKRVGNLPTDYLEMGKLTNVTLRDGDKLSSLDITLAEPVPTTTTTLTYDLGAYAASGSGSTFSVKVATATLPLTGTGPLPSGTIVTLPTQGGSLMVKGEDADGNQVFVVTPAVLTGTTHITLPATDVLKNSLPLDGAVGVNTTPMLAWTPVSEVGFYSLTLQGSGSALSYQWNLAGNSLSVPDYSLLSGSLANGTNYRWSVVAFKGEGFSVDALTDPNGIKLEFMIFSKPSLSLYSSAATGFTTAP